MTATLIDGQRAWASNRDEREGHRFYEISHLVRTTTALDGPATVMQTPGLPTIGSTWNFDNDIDVWAFCTPYMRVSVHKEKEGDPAKIWKVDQKFTTARPSFQKCQDTTIENPLLEPQRVSGSFVKYTEEAVLDRYGNAITNSAHELYRGPNVEFDASRPTVSIGQNVLNLGLATFSDMINKVNSVPQWGLPVRTIKLSNVSWTRNVYGVCFFYYTRDFEFDIRYDTFDRSLLDEGSKALNGEFNQTDGGWDLIDINGAAPDPGNPEHFIRIKDRRDENIRTPLCKGIPGGASTVLINNAAAVDKGDGTVGIPITGHTISVGDAVTISGSLNYNGKFTVISTSANEIVITATYVAETFAGTERVTTWSVCYIQVEKYEEANFFDLGIPITL